MTLSFTLLALDSLQFYLLVVNFAAFVAFSLDCLVFRRDGQDGANPLALCVFALAGGGAGMLIAFLAWDRHVNKGNVAWRMLSLASIVVWALICASAFSQQSFSFPLLVSSLQRDHTPLWIYLACANVLTLVLFVVDKVKATRGSSRIPEFALLLTALLGGALGEILGMVLTRHKVNTSYFKFGLPALLILNLAVVAYLLQTGLV